MNLVAWTSGIQVRMACGKEFHFFVSLTTISINHFLCNCFLCPISISTSRSSEKRSSTTQQQLNNIIRHRRRLWVVVFVVRGSVRVKSLHCYANEWEWMCTFRSITVCVCAACITRLSTAFTQFIIRPPLSLPLFFACVRFERIVTKSVVWAVQKSQRSSMCHVNLCNVCASLLLLCSSSHTSLSIWMKWKWFFFLFSVSAFHFIFRICFCFQWFCSSNYTHSCGSFRDDNTTCFVFHLFLAYIKWSTTTSYKFVVRQSSPHRAARKRMERFINDNRKFYLFNSSDSFARRQTMTDKNGRKQKRKIIHFWIFRSIQFRQRLTSSSCEVL